MAQTINVNALNYPVIVFSEEMFVVKTTSNELTTCPASALKWAWFRGMLIVDSNGMAFKVEGARKVGNAGWSWAGPFPIRIVKVGLLRQLEAFYLSTDETREYVYNAA